MAPNFIDYSQYKLFMKCPLAWKEKYINQIGPEPYAGQRNDPMTVGSLVHAGLETLRLTGTPEITQEAIALHQPTPEALASAIQLIMGYIQAFPDEQRITKRYYMEQPLRFGLRDAYLEGLAKIDCYFRLNETTTLPDGLGSVVSLPPGWWIHEYKTKDASKNFGNYIEGWRMNMQPYFQMLALEQAMGSPIQGVLVNVLERVKPYQPQRSCKACKKKFEFRDWGFIRETSYACPGCNNQQVLEIPEAKEAPPPKYYRLAVQKTKAELSLAAQEISIMAHAMYYIGKGSMPTLRATERCVDSIFGKCEYFDPHSSGAPAKGWTGFVPIDSLAYVNR